MIDGRAAHSILVEVFTSDGVGTMVLPDDEPVPSPFTAPIPQVAAPTVDVPTHQNPEVV